MEKVQVPFSFLQESELRLRLVYWTIQVTKILSIQYGIWTQSSASSSFETHSLHCAIVLLAEMQVTFILTLCPPRP